MSEAIRNVRRGKAHKPVRPDGFRAQADKTTALTRCGYVLRGIEVVPRQQVANEDACRICWPREDA